MKDKNKAKERRVHPRVDTVIRTDFQGASDFAESFLGNISKGGLLVKASKPLKVKDRFKLKFEIEGLPKKFEGLLKVMWVQELYDKNKDKLVPVMGCKFVEIPKEDLAEIERFVTSKLKQN